MIRPAKLSDLRNLLALTRGCARKMQGQGIFQWNEHYPSEAVFTKDVQRRELFLLEAKGETLGAVVLTSTMDPEYGSIEWLTPDGNNGYVHRLCVHPDHWGKGHARRLMDFAEERSRGNGFVSVRLDTFSQNRRNQEFYRQRGYQRLGEVYFPKQSPHPFYCFELLL